MTNILFLKPRLDCTFKPGPCPLERDMSVPLPPIRQHWENFANRIVNHHKQFPNHDIKVLEAPLWTFTPELVNDLKPDLVYIPHKQNYQFRVNNLIETRYYMQTVFPWLFTVDPEGWGADSLVYKNWFPYQIGFEDAGHFEKLQERFKRNESKFAQPDAKIDTKDYILFVCQIPHDEVIKLHSTVSVIEALNTTLKFARLAKKHCIVKGHPVNPGSMVALKQHQETYADCSTWVDDVSISSLLLNAESVFLVNSGVGYEALLAEKPVFCFGKVEYDCVVNKVQSLDAQTLLEKYNTNFILKNYKKFINQYVSLAIDTTI